MQRSQRQTELDILRLLATLAVIMIHSGILGSAAHVGVVWCVPAFFMISGRFFLDPQREVSIGKLWRKQLLRIAVAFVIWSAVYTVYYVATGAYQGLNLFGILTQYLVGPYHFWYLYALAGLYILTPLLRPIAADEKLCGYFLVLFGLCNIAFEYLIYLPKVGGVLENLLTRFRLDMVTQYVGYYMLGWFLWNHRDHMSKRTELAVYILGILMFLGTVVAECLVSEELREADFVKQYMKPNVVIYSAAIYLFFVKRVSQLHFSEKVQSIFAMTTEYGFGVYCAHAIVLLLCANVFRIGALRVIVAYVVSLGIAMILRRIPVIGKKIT